MCRGVSRPSGCWGVPTCHVLPDALRGCSRALFRRVIWGVHLQTLARGAKLSQRVEARLLLVLRLPRLLRDHSQSGAAVAISGGLGLRPSLRHHRGQEIVDNVEVHVDQSAGRATAHRGVPVARRFSAPRTGANANGRRVGGRHRCIARWPGLEKAAITIGESWPTVESILASATLICLCECICRGAAAGAAAARRPGREGLFVSRRDESGARMLDCAAGGLGGTGPLSQGVQARRKALRIRYINGMEVREKRPRGFK